MFEKYNIDDLYYCTMQDMVPIGITNFGGCISIEGSYDRTYETIVYFKDGKYYDINHIERIINVIKCPQMNCPTMSSNHHLYILLEETLVPYREQNYTDKNILQRLPFGKTRHL